MQISFKNITESEKKRKKKPTTEIFEECLWTNRYSTCIIIVCGLKVLLNQDQFQRIQMWHSLDLILEDQSYIDNVSNYSIIL